MKFTISQSVVGDQTYYVARDPWGRVRIRRDTLEQMEEAIEEFNAMGMGSAPSVKKVGSRGRKAKGVISAIAQGRPVSSRGGAPTRRPAKFLGGR